MHVPLGGDLVRAIRVTRGCHWRAKGEGLDQFGVGQRDPADVEPGEERGRVEVWRRLVPDHANGLEQVAVELVGNVLLAVPMSLRTTHRCTGRPPQM